MKNKFFLVKLVLSLAGLVAITGLQQLESGKTYAGRKGYAVGDSSNNLSDPLFEKAKAMANQSFNKEVEENKENEENGLVVYKENNFLKPLNNKEDIPLGKQYIVDSRAVNNIENNQLAGKENRLVVYKENNFLKPLNNKEDIPLSKKELEKRYDQFKDYGILNHIKSEYIQEVVDFLGNIARQYIVTGVDDNYNLISEKEAMKLIDERVASLKSALNNVNSVEELFEYFDFSDNSNGELVLGLLIPKVPSSVPLSLFYNYYHEKDDDPNNVERVADRCFSKIKSLFRKNKIKVFLSEVYDELIKVLNDRNDLSSVDVKDEVKQHMTDAFKSFHNKLYREFLHVLKYNEKTEKNEWVDSGLLDEMKKACPREMKKFCNEMKNILGIKDNNDDIKESDFAEVQDRVTNRFNVCLVKKLQLFLTQLCDAIESVSGKLVKAGVYNKDNVDGLNDFKTEFNNSLIQTKLDGDYDFEEDERVLLDDFLCLVGFFSNADNYANLDIALSPVEDVEGDLANEAKKFKEALLKEYDNIYKFFRDTVQPVLTKIVGNKKITSESIAKNEKTVNNFINNGEHLYYSKDLKDKVFRVLVNRKFNDIKKLNKYKDKFTDSITITQDRLKKISELIKK